MTAKILHIINGESYAGAERVQDLLAASLPAEGFEVGFACLKQGVFADKRHYRAASLVTLPMRSRFDLSVVKRLSEHAVTGGYRALHAHTPRSALAACLTARLTGLPFVYHIHSPAARDTESPLRNFINKQVDVSCARRAWKLIAVSQSLQKQLRQAGQAEDKVALVPNGVPVVSDKCGWQVPQCDWVLGMVALFRPRKGVEALLHALANLRQQGLKTRLRAVGVFENADYEKEIHQLASRLGLDGAIDWVGFTTNINAEFSAMNALVIPSLFGEGLPMVMIEAMAAGLPVIGTQVEGIPEVLGAVSPDCLVPPDDVGALTIALQKLVTGQCNAQQWALDGHALQRVHYSDRAMARGVAEVYRQVIS